MTARQNGNFHSELFSVHSSLHRLPFELPKKIRILKKKIRSFGERFEMFHSNFFQKMDTFKMFKKSTQKIYMKFFLPQLMIHSNHTYYLDEF